MNPHKNIQNLSFKHIAQIAPIKSVILVIYIKKITFLVFKQEYEYTKVHHFLSPNVKLMFPINGKMLSCISIKTLTKLKNTSQLCSYAGSNLSCVNTIIFDVIAKNTCISKSCSQKVGNSTLCQLLLLICGTLFT